MPLFRVTGTNDGMVLKTDDTVRKFLGVVNSEGGVERSDAEWVEIFANGGFSTQVPTEAIKKGSENEDAVINQIRSNSNTSEVLQACMLGMKENSSYACSPDGIGVLKGDVLRGWVDEDADESIKEGDVLVAAL